jgi:antitoxin component YwqK of YwqJK toxin-antitoxin module
MKNIFFGIALLLSATAFAQFNYSETAPNGTVTAQGQYSSDPGITASDSKQTIATKLAAVSKVGQWKYWTESGVLIGEEHYTMSGVRTGIWKTWTPAGVLSTEINFTTGTAVFYHANGQKAEEGAVNTEMQHIGQWKGWHENGTLNYEGSFDTNGNKIGQWKFYDAQGNSVGTENH